MDPETIHDFIHDLRNNQNVIQGSTELLHTTILSPEQQHYLKMLRHGLRDMDKNIENMKHLLQTQFSKEDK